SSSSLDGVDKPNVNFIPQELVNKMGKDGCKRLECIHELAKHRTAEVFSVIDGQTLHWMYENLTSSGIENLVSRIAQTIPDDDHMDEYWGIRKPYFDFRRIKFHDSATQIAIV